MTPYVVVDTNVMIAANGRKCADPKCRKCRKNGREQYIDSRCQEECINKLQEIYNGQIVTIDDQMLILKEYNKGHFNHKGSQGVGDKLYKYIWHNRWREDRVRQVPITLITRCDRQDFKELPENALHEDDRKFLATAVVAQATILNATDSDWSQKRELIDSLGVTVQELCPHILKTR